MNVLLVSVQRNLDILGLKYLHQLLLDKGHHAVLLYLPAFDPDRPESVLALREFLRREQPSLIGVSLMAIDYQWAVEVSRLCRETLPGTPVVWGGIHPTTAPETCVDHADYVCIGEGEQTILDMVTALEAGRSLDDVANLCRRDGDELRRNPLYPLVEDLDSLPLLRQMPENSFVHMGDDVRPLTLADLRKHKRYRGGVYKILTSRGCPYACTYCVNNFLRKAYGEWRVRRRGVAHVMAELELALKEGPRLEYVDFSDDCFLAAPIDYLELFRREYLARIKRPFIVKGTPKYVSEKKIQLLKDAGLAWINLGLQSGSDRVCHEIYGRQMQAGEFLEAAKLIHRHRLAAYYDVIVDNPFETDEDILETVETLMAVPRPFYTLVFSLTFYQGTELYARALKECPERVPDAYSKDYRERDTQTSTMLIEMAGLLHRPWLKRLVRRYRLAPNTASTLRAIRWARLYTKLALAPISYLRLIRRTQQGSLWRTLRVLPIYLVDGFIYLTGSLKWLQRHGE